MTDLEVSLCSETRGLASLGEIVQGTLLGYSCLGTVPDGPVGIGFITLWTELPVFPDLFSSWHSVAIWCRCFQGLGGQILSMREAACHPR